MEFKYANFANEVTDTTSKGTSSTMYRNQGVKWQGELSDAAKESMYFLDSVDVKVLPEGNAQYVVNYRNYYPKGADVSFDTSEVTTSDIAGYGTNHIDGVVITPDRKYISARITNLANRRNIRDLVADKREELSFALADLIDVAISTALGDATETVAGTAGAIQLYGGDAYTDTTLATGDVLTTELFNKAEVLLNGNKAYYWSGSTFTLSTGTKNPWRNDVRDPFVCIIGQRQKQALRDSSQFTNASEYGDRIVISSGEIGSYLGTRIIVSNNVESVASGTGPDGNTVGVAMTRCILMKGKAAYTHVFGQKPTFKSWDLPWRDQKGITLTADYAGSVVHGDAIIWMDVADE